MIQEKGDQIREIGVRIEEGFCALAAEFPNQVSAAHGRGYLGGLKFRQVQAALQFHRRLLEARLWTRAHAYHEGHSTVLNKPGLLADEQIVDFLLARFRKLLQAGAAKTAKPK